LPGHPLVKQRFNHAAYFNKVSISATASFVDSMRRGRGPHLKPREVDDLRPDAAPQRARGSLWRALERPKHTVLNLTAPSHFFFNSNSVPYPGSLRPRAAGNRYRAAEKTGVHLETGCARLLQSTSSAHTKKPVVVIAITGSRPLFQTRGTNRLSRRNRFSCGSEGC
jgi:hypothetical protein